MNRLLPPVLVLTVLMIASTSAQESVQLKTAKELYASARYDEALALLDNLRSTDGSDRKSVEQYRSLCLLALGRTTEAESAVSAMITADPMFRPGEEASPRLRVVFADVRKRLLPEITASRYAIAKASYDRQDWKTAEQEFHAVLALLDEAGTTGTLKDLRLLAEGFAELSARAAAPPPEPATPDPATPDPATSDSAPPAVQAPPAIASPPPPPDPARVYTTEDAEVVPPLVVRQQIPPVPAALVSRAKSRGLLEIVIDDKGRVIRMTMRDSVHPSFDRQILVAARDWKYKPAMLNGQPVRFKKLIQVSVNR